MSRHFVIACAAAAFMVGCAQFDTSDEDQGSLPPIQDDPQDELVLEAYIPVHDEPVVYPDITPRISSSASKFTTSTRRFSVNNASDHDIQVTATWVEGGEAFGFGWIYFRPLTGTVASYGSTFPEDVTIPYWREIQFTLPSKLGMDITTEFGRSEYRPIGHPDHPDATFTYTPWAPENTEPCSDKKYPKEGLLRITVEYLSGDLESFSKDIAVVGSAHERPCPQPKIDGVKLGFPHYQELWWNPAGPYDPGSAFSFRCGNSFGDYPGVDQESYPFPAMVSRVEKCWWSVTQYADLDGNEVVYTTPYHAYYNYADVDQPFQLSLEDCGRYDIELMVMDEWGVESFEPDVFTIYIGAHPDYPGSADPQCGFAAP